MSAIKRAHYSRSAHRSRHHESAHQDESTPAAKIPQHPLIPRNAAELVSTPDALAALIDELRASGQFAYDSEFIGELTYHPKLCLLQVASAKRVSLIDPLADLDLSAFWELLCDPSVEKIVHAGAQDVEPVVRHIGKEPANLFDTQIAAGMARYAYPIALAKLVMEITGAKLGKGLTFTHWDQRPLSAMQLRYAADDVRYLPAVRAAIGNRLEKLGHVDWAKQECAAMCNASQYVFDPQTAYLRVRGASSLPPQGLAVLRELTIWRDQAARQEDVPPRAMLKDEILMALSRNPVRSIDKLSRVRGLPRPIESAHGQQIVDATLHAMALPRTQMPEPRAHEPSPTERFCAESLWAAAQAICASQGVDPALATTHTEIADLFRRLTANQPTDDLRLFKTWRAEALGKPLLELIREGKSFEFTWRDGCLITES